MQRFSTFTKVAALALVIGLNACKKNIPETQSSAATETGAAEEGRFGFTDYNRNLTFYGLTTDNKIDKYSTVIPKRLLGSSAVSGLQPAETLLAIDFMPATGQLYGLGSSSRIYVVNPVTVAARAIGAGAFTPVLVVR